MRVAYQHRHLYRCGGREYDLASRTHVMGILNVTPDSFYDGGKWLDPDSAVERALKIAEEGADFLDIGGESTRPRGSAYGEGAAPVSVEEELRRIMPVVEAVARRVDIPVSIDTYKSEVARQALMAGASMVNDITGFHFDPEMPAVVGNASAAAVVMHMKGSPQTMQVNPRYEDLFSEITGYLEESLSLGRKHGVENMMVDPGIGFGKRLEHNLQLIAGLERFRSLGVPILIGPSRKSFIGNVLNLPVEERLEGSIAAVVACILNGANVVRVHDVAAAKRAAGVADAILRSGTSAENT